MNKDVLHRFPAICAHIEKMQALAALAVFYTKQAACFLNILQAILAKATFIATSFTRFGVLALATLSLAGGAEPRRRGGHNYIGSFITSKYCGRGTPSPPVYMFSQ